MLPVYPPLEAYRRDLERLGGADAFGPNDADWLAASVALQRYAEADAAERARLAPELAKHLAANDDLTVAGAGLRFAQKIEQAGAMHLAASWLALLERLLTPDRVLERGRILTQRASLLRKTADANAARELYEEIERLAETHAEPELTARAWLGFAILAQMHGNYPEARRWYQAAALVADDNGCTTQSYNAHVGLMGAAIIAKDFDRAMTEGWTAFSMSENDPDREATVLSNMAQLMYDAGAHHTALHGFSAAVARSSRPEILFGALGGAAMAAAQLEQPAVVDAVAARITQISGSGWPFPLAQALLDLADARDIVGAHDAAERDRAWALGIARERSFHALVYRAENAERPSRSITGPVAFSGLASQVIEGIERLPVPGDLAIAR